MSVFLQLPFLFVSSKKNEKGELESIREELIVANQRNQSLQSEIQGIKEDVNIDSTISQIFLNPKCDFLFTKILFFLKEEALNNELRSQAEKTTTENLKLKIDLNRIRSDLEISAQDNGIHCLI